MRSTKAVAAAMAATAILGSGAGESNAGEKGPFNVLEWKEGVTTSRDGYSVWVLIESRHHRAKIPGHESEVGKQEGGDGSGSRHGAVLGVSCRAKGVPDPELAGPWRAHGRLWMDDHPQQRDAYTVWHPKHWLLELADKHKESWAVKAIVGEQAEVETTLERRLTDYSAPRIGIEFGLPGDTVIEAILNERQIEVRASGDGAMEFSGMFVPARNTRTAAALMKQHCLW